MTGVRRWLGVVGAVVLLLATAPAVRACSCVPERDPRMQLARASAAFVGVLVAKPASEMNDSELKAWEFKIERTVKGDLVGERVTVWASTHDGMCGLSVDEGERIGLFLHRMNDGRWSSGSCSTIAPDRLLRAAEPMPAPDGQGPAAFVMAGRFGDARLVSLDEQGRTLAYGTGRADYSVSDVSACPGGRRAVLATTSDAPEGARIWLHDLPLLGLAREMPHPGPALEVVAVACGDEAGDTVYAAYQDAQRTISIHRIARTGPPRVVWSGPAQVGPSRPVLFDAQGRFAVVVMGSPPALVRVELARGRVRQIPLPEAVDDVAVSPGGTRIAALAGNYNSRFGPSPQPPRLRVYGSDGRLRGERAKDAPGSWNSIVWTGEDVLLASGSAHDAFDSRLRPVGAWDGELGFRRVPRLGRLFVFGDVDLMLRSVDPVRGTSTVVHGLPDMYVVDIGVVPPPPPPPPPPPSTTSSTAPPVTPATADTLAVQQPSPTTTAGDDVVALPTSGSQDDGGVGPLGWLAAVMVLAAGAGTWVARRQLAEVDGNRTRL